MRREFEAENMIAEGSMNTMWDGFPGFLKLKNNKNHGGISFSAVCFSVLLVSLICVSGELRAGVSVFDFETVGPDQSGEYELSTELEMDGGLVNLREQYSPPWHMAGWSHRMVVAIDNDTGEILVEVPVRLDLEGAPDEVFDMGRLDGSDMVLVDSDGALVELRWVERFDFIARRGSIWVQLPYLPAGGGLYYLYFGNFDEPTEVGAPEEVFFYSTPVVSSVVLNPMAADSEIIVQSFVDGNEIELSPSTSWSLNARELGTEVSENFQVSSMIAATGPYYAQFSGTGTDAVPFLAYASDVFVYPAPREDDIFDVYSPFGPSELSIYDEGILVASETVYPATPLSIPADITNGNAARLESDLPIVVNKRADIAGVMRDVMPYLPPSTEIVGANSGSGLVAALEDGTAVDIYYSSVSHETVYLDANEVYSLGNSGGSGTGTGDAVNIVASGPIAGLAYGDGDGGEAVTFMPRDELGLRYLIPRNAEYVLISSPSPGVTCRVLNPDGTQAQEEKSDTIAPPYPNRIRFGFIAAGSEISCDKPVFAMMEDQVYDAERNLFPSKAHRPAIYPYPVGSLTSGPETRYAFTNGWVVTPDLEPPEGISALLSFLQTGEIWIPAGTNIKYQLSNNGGSSWYYHDGTEWQQALMDSQANTSYEIDAVSTSFPINDNRIKVKAFLESESGTESPVLDELTLVYAGPGEPAAFVFDSIEGPQTAGVPFEVGLTAVDGEGMRVFDYYGAADLSTYGGSVYPEESPQFEEGRVELEVAVSEIGENVILRAFDSLVFGESNAFIVVAPDPSSLRLELVEGDQQMGTTNEPLAVDPTVRVVSDDTGFPVPGLDVTFLVQEGGGVIDPFGVGENNVEAVVETNAGGLASVVWTMGEDPGRNELQVSLPGAEGSPIVFIARADLPGTEPGDNEFKASGGGCDCGVARTLHGNGGGSLLGFILILLVLVSLSFTSRKK